MALIRTSYLTIVPADYSNPTDITAGKMELSIKKFIAIVTLVNPITNISTVLTEDDFNNLKIISMDDNVFIEKVTEIVDEETFIIGYNLIAIREGSATIKAYLTVGEEVIYGETEIVVFDPWFRDNYWQLIGETDYDAIKPTSDGSYADCLLKACMEMYDVLFAYNKDVTDITDPLFAKNKFIDVLGESRGFVKTDFSTEQLETEYIATQLYRELLSNLYELLNIRGTRLSYEMFFGALGYDIELLEFWFDADGNLVEINPYDNEDGTNTSSFSTYDLTGRLTNSDASLTSDPRLNVSASSAPNYCNKSYFIKPVLSQKAGLEFAGYTIEQRAIIWEYLNYLKPIHMEYLSEVIDLSMNAATPGTIEQYYVLYDELQIESNPTAVNLLLPLYDYYTGINDIRPNYYLQNNPGTAIRLEYNYSTDNLEMNKPFTIIDQSFGDAEDWVDLSNVLIDDITYGYIDIPISNPWSETINLSHILDCDDSMIYDFKAFNAYGCQANRINYRVRLEVTPDGTGEVNLYVRTKINGTSEWTDWIIEDISGGTSVAEYVFEADEFTNPVLTWEEIGNYGEVEIKIENNTDNDVNIKIYYAEANIIYTETDRLGRQIPADPGGLNYSADIIRGTWHRDAGPSDTLDYRQSGGGMAVERLWRSTNNINDLDSWQDVFIVSNHINLSDIITTYYKYNADPSRSYDETGLKYDIGYALLDSEVPLGGSVNRTVGIIPIDIKLFQSEYNSISGSNDAKVMTMLNNPKYIGITKNTCTLVMSYTV